MAKVIAITTLAWDDHRVTVSDEGIDIIFIGRSHEVIDQLKRFNVGDEFDSPFEKVPSPELSEDNAELAEAPIDFKPITEQQ